MGEGNGTQTGSNKWAYLQVVGLAFLMIGGIQTILANSGNFIAVVCPDMGFEVSAFTFWITCYAFGMAASQLYVGKLWLVVRTPVLLTVSFLICIAALACMGLYTELWQWYASGFVIGLSGGCFFMVAAPIVITNWFAKRSGFALGLVTIISAVGTAVLSPVDAAIIAAVGWRMGYLLVALISCVLVLPFTLFVIRYQPSDRGCKPVGWEPGMDNITAGAEDSSGTSLKGGVCSLAFVCLFLAAGLCALFGGYQNQWPVAAVSWGYDLSFGATMISATALFGICAPLIGILIDKLGPFKSTFIVLAGQFLSGLGLIFLHGHPAWVLICVFFFADQMTIVGTLVPLLVRKVFGARNYTKILAYIQIGIGLIGGFSNPIIAALYEGSGDFDRALWFGIGLCVACALLFGGVAAFRKRLKFEGPRTGDAASISTGGLSSADQLAAEEAAVAEREL